MLSIFFSINPSVSETGIFRENYDHNMAAVALPPCVASTSAANDYTV